MNDLTDSFNRIFGPAIDEDNRIYLGNSIIDRLRDLGYSPEENRAIRRGEVSLPQGLPQDLANDIAKWQKLTAEKAKADEVRAEREAKKAEAEQKKIRSAYNKMISGQRLTNAQINLLIHNGYAEDLGHVGGETEAHTWRPTGKKLK